MRHSESSTRSSTGRRKTWSPARLLILSCARTLAPKQALDVVEDDPSDNRILECAAEAGAESAKEEPVDPDHKVAGQKLACSYELNCTP